MTTTTTPAYRELLQSLEEHIGSADLSPFSLDPDFVAFYWEIGKTIITHQADLGWYPRLAKQISKDLRRAFPRMTCLSARALEEVVAFAERWPEREIVQQLVAQAPWGRDANKVERETLATP